MLPPTQCGPLHERLTSISPGGPWTLRTLLASWPHRQKTERPAPKPRRTDNTVQTRRILVLTDTGYYKLSDVGGTMLPLGPTALEVSREEQRSPSLVRLYNQNGGFHLRIQPDGTVTGGRQESDPYDILRLKAVSIGVVVIKGEETGRYVAMDKNGNLYSSQDVDDECYFLEKYEENHYNTYRSQKYNWYIGLNRQGRPKAGPKTHQGQKAIYFLPRHVGNL